MLDPAGSPKFVVSHASGKQITHLESINVGDKKSRIKLIQGDDTFNIFARALNNAGEFSLNSIVEWFTNVTIQSGSQVKYSINISSTAKRLGITPKEVKEIAKRPDAFLVLQNKAKIRKKALEKYEGIVKNYINSKEGLKSKGNRIKTGLKPEIILKVIAKGMSISDNNATFKAQLFKENGVTLYGSEDLQKFHLVKKELGVGSYGTVFETIELTNAEIKALKDTFSSIKPQDAPDQLKNEYTTLNDINSDGPHKGIPKTPSEITNIANTKHNFLDMELLSGDLLSYKFYKGFEKLRVADRLKLCGQLIHGLAVMHKKGYSHGDIKPENCLMKLNSKNKPAELFLSDFGGASKGIPVAYTAGYLPNDYRRTKESANKADVYALSKTIIEVLHGKSVERMGITISDKTEIYKKVDEGLSKKGIPQDVRVLLLKGMGPEAQRPTAAELQQAYIKAISPKG